MVQLSVPPFGASTLLCTCSPVLMAGCVLNPRVAFAATTHAAFCSAYQELAYELEDMQVALDKLLAILNKAMGVAC